MSVQARPQDYARAIYDLALEAWTGQLEAVQKALRADGALRARVMDDETPVADRLQLAVTATRGALSGPVRSFVGTLLESGQLDQLDRILIELEHLALRRPQKRIAHVTSAVPLTPAEQAALGARLVAKFGTDIELQFDVDAALIGGIRLRVGDQVIDGSVAGKLAAMREKLSAA